MAIPDHSIRISIDRGGTFTDCHAQWPVDKSEQYPEGIREAVIKLLSSDPANYPDAPTEGIRRILRLVYASLSGSESDKYEEELKRGKKINTTKIEYIRLSTTVGTNALLERKGEKHALLITKGFKDLLKIGHQSRPRIFDLHIRLPPPLYSTVVEIDERVTLVGYSSDPKRDERAVQFDEKDGKWDIARHYDGDEKEGLKGTLQRDGVRVVRGVSGEAVAVIKEPDMDAVRTDLQNLLDQGISCVAIVLAHSYTFPEHEFRIAKLAQSMGFAHISTSSTLVPMIKLVNRGNSTTADAYLTPVLKGYMDTFFDALEGGREQKGCRVEYMSSDGGLVEAAKFSGLKSVLSGPAGGVVGYALTGWGGKGSRPVIGLDMGGTSTDVSRFDGRFEIVYETTTAGVTIQSPQLDINTVAAGGGSCLTFENGLFKVGPESAGAHPGPACYRKGGPLAITDANLVLGRILPDYFPKIFGKSEKEPLDVEASRSAFQKLADQINASLGHERKMSIEEVAFGFIQVANEAMCRPIRAITEAKGVSLPKHVLSCFGGAGGQHSCGIARVLDIDTVLIHKHSSILSAYGLALADRVFEKQEPASDTLSDATLPHLQSRWEALEREVRDELRQQGFKDERIRSEVYLNCRFDGTDTALMTLKPGSSTDFHSAFTAQYKREFGFVLDKPVIVDDVRVRGIGKSFDSLGAGVWAEVEQLERDGWRVAEGQGLEEEKRAAVYYEEKGREEVRVFLLGKLRPGHVVTGPAMIIDDTQTIVLDHGAAAHVTSQSLVIRLARKGGEGP